MKLKSNCPICGNNYIPSKDMVLSEAVAKIIYDKIASYTKSNTNNEINRNAWEICSVSRKSKYFNAAHALIMYFKKESQ